MNEINTVESILFKKYRNNKFFTLQELWFELRVESDDTQFCKTWQTTYNQMINQLNLLVELRKVYKTTDNRYKLFSRNVSSSLLDCTNCGKPSPWKTIDVNGEALCFICSI
jgi:hypothetical protein